MQGSGGSTRRPITRSLNYAPNSRAFSEDDMPPHVRKIREEVRKAKQRNVLGSQKAPWDPSSHVERPQILQHQIKAYCSIPPVINFRAQTLPKPDGHFIAGVDDKLPGKGPPKLSATQQTRVELPDDDVGDKPRWVFETTVDKKLWKSKEENERKAAEEACQRSKTMVKEYTNPTQAQAEMIVRQREKKKAEAERLQRLKDLYGESYEPLSEEEQQRRKEETRLHSMAVIRTPKERVYSHKGSWAYNDVEGCFAWSCCMNFEEKSKGCSYTIRR